MPKKSAFTERQGITLGCLTWPYQRCDICLSFIVHMLHPQFCLWSLCWPLPPTPNLLRSLHPLIPLHTSINRALQSARSHTVLNAAVVQLQWATADLYHWIKHWPGRKAERAKTRDEPHSFFFYPPIFLGLTPKPLSTLEINTVVKLLLPFLVSTHTGLPYTRPCRLS